MTTPLVPHPEIGEFLCHAHLRGDVNNPMIAACIIRHLDAVSAADCKQRRTKMDSYGTSLFWGTCRPEFCRVGRRNRTAS